MKHLTYFTPGPSQLFPTARRHLLKALDMHIPSISHRSDDFHKIFRDTTTSLRSLLCIPETYHIFFVSSATEAMERIIQNSVRDMSFHLVNGAFSRLFFTVAKTLGKNATKMEVAPGHGFTVSDIDMPRNTELVCLTHNETSTGACWPQHDIYDLRNRYPDPLFAIDIVSSVPCHSFDIALFDCIFFSVQKGFGMPAGLGVLIVSPRALEKASYLESKKQIVGSFHRFSNLFLYAQKQETPETPNVLSMYLLAQITKDMLKIGINNIHRHTTEKANVLYRYYDNHNRYAPFITEKRFRSETVIVIDVAGNSDDIVHRLAKKGIVVGKGYKEHKHSHIRIANFPAHSTEDIELLIHNIG